VSTRRGQLLTRRALIVGNAVLGVVLVASLAVLVWYFSSRGAIVRGGEVTSGIRPVLTVEGPGRGQYPQFTRPMDAAFGPEGRIYVLDSGSSRVVILGPTGRYEGEFGGFGTLNPFSGHEASWGEGLMNHPVGIDVDEDGSIYVADLRNGQIQVFDPDGVFVRRFPEPEDAAGEGTGEESGIAFTDVAAANGLVFAADSTRLHVFATSGELVRTIGGPGSGVLEFDGITGIDVTDDGRIYVADSGNNRIQTLTTEGQFLWSVGRSRTAGDGDSDAGSVSPYEFGIPRSVAVMGDGTIAVLDALESSIVLLTRDGQFIGRYGERGTAPGQLGNPHSIQALGNRLLVSDTGNDRIQVLEVVR
jgi:DNA-binding beta-propeller fold protein YncE